MPRSFSALSSDYFDRIAVLRPGCTGLSDGEEMCTAGPAVRGAYRGTSRTSKDLPGTPCRSVASRRLLVPA